MNIYKSAVNSPITTILIFVAIAIFGVFSLVKLAIDLMPYIETTRIMVITAYPARVRWISRRMSPNRWRTT